MDGLKNRLNGALRNAVVPGDFGEGDWSSLDPEGWDHRELVPCAEKAEPSRDFQKSRVTFFTVEPAFVKGNSRSPVIGRDMAYGLPDAGILDDAVGGVTV